MQEVLASQKTIRPTWGLGFQLNCIKHWEAGKGNSWQLVWPHASNPCPPTVFALEGYKQSSYIWDRICYPSSFAPVREEHKYQQSFPSRDSSKLSGKTWREYRLLKKTNHAFFWVWDTLVLPKDKIINSVCKKYDHSKILIYFPSLNKVLNLRKLVPFKEICLNTIRTLQKVYKEFN